MKIINFIASAVALFATTTPQLVTAQRIVSRTGGVRGLSNSDETKEMMGKIMNTIVNMHPEGREEGNDIVERMLSNDKTMESIAKLKDALSSVDMSEMINTVVEHNNKHGRKLEIDQGAMDEFIGLLKEQMDSLGLDNLDTNDLGGRMLLAKEQGSDIMESIEKVKDVLGSLDKDTDMTEVIESFMTTNNKHGRHLQSSFCETLYDQLINQLTVSLIVLSLIILDPFLLVDFLVDLFRGLTLL